MSKTGDYVAFTVLNTKTSVRANDKTLGFAYASSAEGWRGRRFRRYAQIVVVAVATFLVAYDSGSYGVGARATIAFLLLWCLAIAVVLGFWPRARIPWPAVAVGVALTGLTAWTAFSLLWSSDAERTFTEVNRVLLFLVLYAVVVASSPEGRGSRRWLHGFALAITGVAVLATASRLVPTHFSTEAATQLVQLFPAAQERLSYPLLYWNGLATLLALGVPCLLFTATTDARAWVRALAALPLPLFGLTIYLTSSRGGIVASALATLTFLALSARRWSALAVVVPTGAAAVATVWFTTRQDLVVAGRTGPDVDSQGYRIALFLLVASVAAAALVGLLTSIDFGRRGAARPLGYALAIAGVAAIAVGIVAAHPQERFENFKAVPEAGSRETVDLEQHLASGSGNGRWQLWVSAVDEAQADPLTGGSAGSYEAWWTQRGSLQLFVRDAHSLYLETLGELGIVGLVLLVAVFGIALATGIRRSLVKEGDDRTAVAAFLAMLVAYLFEAGIDWMWEMTVVTLVAIVAVGILVGPSTAVGGSRGVRPFAGRRRVSYPARALVVILALAAVVSEGIPFATDAALERSRSAAQRGDLEAAAESARQAERVQPWAASPRLQSALVAEARRDFPTALTAAQAATQRGSSDWRNWLAAARIETQAGRYAEAAASLEMAKRLNPRSISTGG